MCSLGHRDYRHWTVKSSSPAGEFGHTGTNSEGLGSAVALGFGGEHGGYLVFLLLFGSLIPLRFFFFF